MEAAMAIDSLNARLDKLIGLLEKRFGEDRTETLLTQKEAARMLGCCSTTLKKMRESGMIKGVPVGKLWKYPLSEIERANKRKI